MQTKQQEHTIQLLRKLGKKESIPRYAWTGICYNIRQATGVKINVIFPEYFTIMRRWKYFSTLDGYPVPPSKQDTSSNSAINAYGKDMWTGTYGEMRRMFARYLVREFTKLYPPN